MKGLEVSEWMVRVLVAVSGVMNIFVAIFVMVDSSFLIMRLFLVLIGIVVITGSATFESWILDNAEKK